MDKRSFLLTSANHDHIRRFGKVTNLRQAYLHGAATVRIRIQDDVIATITTLVDRVSGQRELMRTDLHTAQNLCNASTDQLRKTRYEIDGWHVDYYEEHLEDLVIATVPAHSSEDIDFPHYIPAAIEVTGRLTDEYLAKLNHDLRYSGQQVDLGNLIQHSETPSIVFTGGPCSGKSTLLRSVLTRYPNAEESLHRLPEVASIVIQQAGLIPPNVTGKGSYLEFNRMVHGIQRYLETVAREHARMNDKRALLLDRGSIDNIAYLPNGAVDFEHLTKSTVEDEYEQYTMVICLAVPPRAIYEQHFGNNPARSESWELAVMLEKKILAAWGGHPNLQYVEADTWGEKEARAFALLDPYLG